VVVVEIEMEVPQAQEVLVVVVMHLLHTRLITHSLAPLILVEEEVAQVTTTPALGEQHELEVLEL
jgi:hypothetical protein